MRKFALLLLLIGCSKDPDDETGGTTPTTVTDCPSSPECTTLGDPSTDPSTDPPSPTSSGSTTDSPPDPSTSSSTGGTTDVATTTTPDPTTLPDPSDTDATTTTGPVDCNADCASCWNCAKNGACKMPYDTCQFGTFCIPALTCLDSMCAPGGLQQDCATTCCMSCINLGTCNEVNAALSCIEQQCAGLCNDVVCGQ